MRVDSRLPCAMLACAFLLSGAAAETPPAPKPSAPKPLVVTPPQQKPQRPAQQRKPAQQKKPVQQQKPPAEARREPPLTDPPAPSAPPAAQVAVMPCATPALASEQIIEFLNLISARIASGDLMPWDAREASERLSAASQMLGRKDLSGACAAIAEVQRKYRL